VSAVRPVCEWFLGCKQPAVAIVSHPRKPTPACARCIDRMGLRDQIVAAILEPTGGGEPVVMPMSGEHIAGHFFQGVCICPCSDCTEHVADGLVMCTCPGCPAAACGAKRPTSMAGAR